MELSRSRARFEHLTVVESTPSTNDELGQRVADAPHFSVVVTGHQTAGRGRLGRSWSTPAGQALAISVLVRFGGADGGASASIPIERLGWLPLIAGLAMTRTVRSLLPETPVGLKWPNDVQVRGLKVSGILSELVDDGRAVVIGAGLNLAIPADELPTPVSTSLGLHSPTVDGGAAGGDVLADVALLRYLEHLESLVTLWLEHGGDPESSGIRSELVEACTTLGEQVRVQLPDDRELLGAATGIDIDGRLIVAGDDGAQHAVAAGDVTHLRYT